MHETLFIAYAVEDRAYVADLAARIEAAANLRAWYFERDEQYGAHYREEIIKQIDTCRAVLVILSATSAFSRSVEREVDLAIQLNKPIIPIVIGSARSKRIDAQMTRGPVMFELRPRHLIDARAGQDPLSEVLRRLGLPTPPPGPAPALPAAPAGPVAPPSPAPAPPSSPTRKAWPSSRTRSGTPPQLKCGSWPILAWASPPMFGAPTPWRRACSSRPTPR